MDSLTCCFDALLGSLSRSSCRGQCLAELVGTYFLVFFGPASVVVASLLDYSGLEGLAFVALVFGSVVASMIVLLGKSSGAHINPAITLANALAGGLGTDLLAPYVGFQVLGGLLAGLSLRLSFEDMAPAAYLGSTKLAAGVTPIEGFALEAAGTFVLATSAMVASSFVHSTARQGALVGSTLFVLILLLGSLTGASFNPVRSLGPSLFSGYLANQEVYWAGPLVGGALAGVAFGRLKRLDGGE